MWILSQPRSLLPAAARSSLRRNIAADYRCVVNVTQHAMPIPPDADGFTKVKTTFRRRVNRGPAVMKVTNWTHLERYQPATMNRVPHKRRLPLQFNVPLLPPLLPSLEHGPSRFSCKSR